MKGVPIVHVIDDDQAVRESLAFLLMSVGHATKIYASADQLLQQVDGATRGCIVTDIRMPGLSGLDLVAKLKEGKVTLPIVAITGHADVPMAVQAMKAGVLDFIEKPFDEEVILHAVEHALRRESDRSESETEHVCIRNALGTLTTRERQVLDRLVDGQANKAIARDLGISPRTVEVYRANLMSKMGADSLSKLVRMMMSIGARTPPPSPAHE